MGLQPESHEPSVLWGGGARCAVPQRGLQCGAVRLHAGGPGIMASENAASAEAAGGASRGHAEDSQGQALAEATRLWPARGHARGAAAVEGATGTSGAAVCGSSGSASQGAVLPCNAARVTARRL